MKIIKKEKIKFIRILIGNCETGTNGLKKPIKSINILDSSVNEVYDLIKKTIEKLEVKK